MNDTLKLTDDQVLVHARHLLREHLPLTAAGTCCTTDELVNVLLGVAVNQSTLEAVCHDWLTVPDPETVRHYLNEQLCVEDLPELERRLNAALQAEIPRRIWRQAREVAAMFMTARTTASNLRWKGCGYAAKHGMAPPAFIESPPPMSS